MSVGSLLHDTIHMGLTLTVKQLTEYGAMLKRGDTGVSSDVNLPYLVVGCSYACSNLIDKASHKVTPPLLRFVQDSNVTYLTHVATAGLCPRRVQSGQRALRQESVSASRRGAAGVHILQQVCLIS